MSEGGITGITDDVKDRVTSTWTNFYNKQEDREQLGVPMFMKLFERMPETKDLFRFDETNEGCIEKLKSHIKLLFDTINYAIESIDKLEELTPIIIDLGTRHVYYGVKQKYYLVFGECLVYAIETGLGSEFSEKDKEAWMTFYHWIGGCIVKGMCMESYSNSK